MVCKLFFNISANIFKFYYHQILRKLCHVVTKRDNKVIHKSSRSQMFFKNIFRRYPEKQLFQNSKDNMLRNSISVDRKAYAQQLKEKSTE